MSDPDPEHVSRREKVAALLDVARFDPASTASIVVLGLVAALLEGVGISFIIPVAELAQNEDPAAAADGVLALFVSGYRGLGLSLSLGAVLVGVAAVITARYATSFLVDWLRDALRLRYIRDLQIRAFENALAARVAYFDEEGSDDILNAVVTQTYYAGRVILRVVRVLEFSFLSLVYLALAFAFAPYLTVVAVAVLGGLTVLFRHVIEPGYELGDVVADANERRQEAAQAGTQGIRDVRLFGLAEELHDDFVEAVDRYTGARIRLRRNEAGLERFYNLGVALAVFTLIYLALAVGDLSLAALAVFLFAIVRLGPKVSALNRNLYQAENDLPHLVRTQQFIRDLERREEPTGATREVPATVERVAFEDVWFSYGDEPVLRGIDLAVERGEFVGIVGQSGAGKSTIVSLLARLYEVDRGTIRADGVPIDEMDVDAWRDRVAVVRQQLFVFNDTLRYNLTIGNRDASEDELDRVCEIARVDEFLEDLPEGYDTVLGDEGVRLSGGQKQRVALARALLEDADLLVLDEATSDLDSTLEREVQRAIEGMDREYAVVTIAHRLSTVKNADRIYTVEDGRITERGNHRELVERDGTYAELYGIQSRG